MPAFNATRSNAPHLGLRFAVLLLGAILTATALGGARANEASASVDAETLDPGEHMVRRCKLGSKQELCYWAKVGSHHNGER